MHWSGKGWGVLEREVAVEPKMGSQGELQISKIVTLNPDGSLYFLLNIGYSIQKYGRRVRYCTAVTLPAIGSNKWNLPSKCRDKWQIINGKVERRLL